MEGDTLHPTTDSSGKHIFELVEVVGVAQKRSHRALEPSREGERDARAFELLEAGRGIRDLVTTLRISADVATRIANAWREAGGRDIIVPAVCRSELTKSLGQFRDAVELVQRAREAADENDRAYEESRKLHHRLENLVVLFGQLATRFPALETALPEVRERLDAELVETLDYAFAVGSQRPSAERRSETTADEASLSKAMREASCDARVPAASDAPLIEACTASSAPATSDLRSTVPTTERASMTNDTTQRSAAAANEADSGAGCTAVSHAIGLSAREKILDAWLTSLVADEVRLQRLATLLKREELEMFAELERGIGVGDATPPHSGSMSREQLLEVLLVNIMGDEARLDKIGALLTPRELDMLAELGRGLSHPAKSMSSCLAEYPPDD